MNAQGPRRLGLLAIPGVLVSLLPVLACSWAGIVVLISSLGLGFVGSSRFLLPVTGVLLAVAVVGLGMQIKTAGYGPFVLGVVSVAAILPSKFAVGSKSDDLRRRGSPNDRLGMQPRPETIAGFRLVLDVCAFS
jgi:hypothetical protein